MKDKTEHIERRRQAGYYALFHGGMSQRALVALAVHGDQRIKPLQIALKTRKISDIDALERTGLTSLWGIKGRARKIGLNRSFPAYPQLRRLLRKIAEIEGVVDVPSVNSRERDEIGPQPKRDKDSLQYVDLFGNEFRTRTLLAIYCVGNTSLSELRLALRYSRTTIKRQVQYWADQRIVAESGARIRLNPRWPAFAEIVAFLAALIKLRPELRVDAAAPPKRHKATRRTRIDWDTGVQGDELPLGVQPPADGAPLLFGSDARRRIICLLAANGPLSAPQIVRVGKVGSGTLDEVAKTGLLTCWPRTSANAPRIFELNPAFPGYASLLQVSNRLNDRFSVPQVALSHPKGRALPARTTPSSCSGDIATLFGSVARTGALMCLIANGPSTVSDIKRMIRDTERHEVLRALKMWRKYGIVCRVEPGQKWTLDDEWFAADELRRLLEDLVAFDGRHKARSDALKGRKG